MIARVPQSYPLILSAKLGLVSIPNADLLSHPKESAEALDRNAVRELLCTLGAQLGMSLLTRKDESFPDRDQMDVDATVESISAFPDSAVRQSLEGLDVVWMRDDEVVACFAVESGLAGWESVRRLADLVALHPKLKSPLYAVTLPNIKAGLIAELRRPALLVPKKPLAETIRLLEWDRLKTEVDQLGDRVRYLKLEFLEGISEPIAAPIRFD